MTLNAYQKLARPHLNTEWASELDVLAHMLFVVASLSRSAGLSLSEVAWHGLEKK